MSFVSNIKGTKISQELDINGQSRDTFIMNKALFAFAFLCVPATFAACSSDDPVAATADAGTDATTTPDSSAPDSATADAGSCQTCGDLLTNGQNREACDSATKYIADALGCLCDPGICGAVCGTECQTGVRPEGACLDCFQSSCGEPLAACLQDDGVYRPRDAGVRTDAGAASDAASDAK